MVSIPLLKLNTGAEIPSVGLGCYMGKFSGDTLNTETEDMVKLALKVGYRYFDTASGYGNEEAVGKAIREGGVPREEIHVTTKVAFDYSDVQGSFEKSLQKLGLDYIDLFLIHWPQALDPKTGKILPRDAHPTFEETWARMEKVYAGGKCKAIGVSNFSVKNLKALLKTAKVVPADNQIELNPYLPQYETVDFCKEKGIHVTAYCPLGQYNSPILTDEKVAKIADAHTATPGQVLLSWAVQRGLSVVPKSANEGRLKKNLELLTLGEDEMKVLSNLWTEPGKYKSVCGFNSPIIPEEKGKILGWSIEHDMGWDPKAFTSYY